MKGLYLRTECRNLGRARCVLFGWGRGGSLTGGGPGMGWSRPGVGLGLMEAIKKSCLPSDVEQHIVLKNPNQGSLKDPAIGGERGFLFKGALE